MAEQNKKTKRISVMALFVVTIIWGGGFIFSKMALDSGLAPSLIMMTRFLFAALLTGVIFRKTIKKEYKKGQWKSGLVIGAILFGGFYVQMIALKETTPANSAFITGSYVVMIPLIWWAITKRRPPAIMFLATLISFTGVTILSVNFADGFAASPGDLLTLLAALFFATQIVVTSLLARTIHPTVLVFMQFAVSGLMSLVFFLFSGADFTPFRQPSAVISVAYLAIFSTFTCYLLQTNAQRHVPTAQAGMILATESLFGAAFSVLLGYDTLTVRFIIGGLMMLVSIMLPELWNARHNLRDPKQKNENQKSV